MVTHERSALQPGLYQREGIDTQLRRWKRGELVGHGGGFISAWQISTARGLLIH